MIHNDGGPTTRPPGGRRLPATVLGIWLALTGPALAGNDLPPAVPAPDPEAATLWAFYRALGEAIVDIEALSASPDDAPLALALSVLVPRAGLPPHHFRDLGARLADDRAARCLFAGADPLLLASLDPRGEEAAYCVTTFDILEAEWGHLVSRLARPGPGPALDFVRPVDAPTGPAIAAEIAALNDRLRLTWPVTVALAPCPSPGYSYDATTAQITLCAIPHDPETR